MVDDPTRRHDPIPDYRGVLGTTRQIIQGALGRGLPLRFDPPIWTQRRPLTGEACWSGEALDPGDIDAFTFVSDSNRMVTFCATCLRYWREEAEKRRVWP